MIEINTKQLLSFNKVNRARILQQIILGNIKFMEDNMEDKIEAYEEAQRYINKALEELANFKEDYKTLGIWCDLLDVQDLVVKELEGMQKIIEVREEKEREYIEKEQNRVYREAQGF